MFENDPLQNVERVTKSVHDNFGKHTRPVLKRYPLLFLFLVVFSAAAVLHGFQLFADDVVLFREHPTVLMGLGVLLLFLTGSLYKSLQEGIRE